MKLHAVTFFVLLVFLSVSTASQPYQKRFTLSPEGSNPQINCLYQLRNGYIVVGSTAGLHRFDGTAFHKIQPLQGTSENVTAVFEAANGKVWVGFGDGKLAWLQNNKLELQQLEEGFPKKTIRKILQDATGIVWLATAGEGIYYFTNNRFYNINTDDGLSDNYVYDIALHGNQIAAGTDRGINFCSIVSGRKRVTSITSASGGLPDNIVRCLASDGKSLRFGMQDAGVAAINNATIELQPGWSYGTPNAILTDLHYTWVATDESGLVQLSQTPGKADQPFGGKATALVKDMEGNIWCGGGNILLRTNGSKLQPFLQLAADEYKNLHTFLIDSNDHLWFNIKKGLKCVKEVNGSLQERSYPLPSLINSQITALHEDIFGNIWIGTMGNGVLLLDSKSGKFRKVTEEKILANASVLSISGKDDQVWIASLEGAVRCNLTKENRSIFNPLHLQTFTSIGGIGTNYIYHIYTDSRNRTWFATDGKGIAVYENGKVISYNQKHGLRSDVVYRITEDKNGSIWFITFNGGLVKFDGKSFKHFASSDGLSDLNITAIATDKAGNLYLAHEKGVDILNIANNSISYLDEQLGIGDLKTEPNTLASDSKGNIYFLANGSFYRYRDSDVERQPKVVIDKIQLFLNDVDVQQNHSFDADQNNVSFYYTGLSYTQAYRIQYQYKLDGYGTDWITTSDRRKDFPKLSPGTYTFRVRASFNKNFNNAAEASFTFNIEKPFWMKWWFIVGTAVIISGILYLFIKDRERRLQKWERLEKEKIQSQFETLRNQVNPHFLFNSFNTLVSEIEEDPKRAVAYVEHMADFFRNIVTYREKDIISLKEELQIIKDYLFIQEKRYGAAFQVKVAVSNEDQQRYWLAPLTLQLLAENAIKHNSVLREKPLVLEILVEKDQLVVRNNICPKFHAEKSAGLGLQNIQKRYELLTKKSVIIKKNEYFTVIIPLIESNNDPGSDNRR